jgi:hypothetical protein
VEISLPMLAPKPATAGVEQPAVARS